MISTMDFILLCSVIRERITHGVDQHSSRSVPACSLIRTSPTVNGYADSELTLNQMSDGVMLRGILELAL
jgi:hypothetical protein